MPRADVVLVELGLAPSRTVAQRLIAAGRAAETPVMVAVGQTALAGETVLADLRGSEAPRAFRMG